MDALLVAAQLLLTGVFLVAGGAKLLDLSGSRRAMVDFGVPARAAAVMGALLPLVEIGVAVSLLLRPSARWGALVAAALLLGFVLAIANVMRRGEAPDCHCFGQVQSSPAGGKTLVRNLVLAGIALFVGAWGPAPAIDGWIGDRSSLELLALGLALSGIVLAILLLRARSENARLRRDLDSARSAAPEPDVIHEGLPLGTPAPGFTLPDVSGAPISLGSLLAGGRPVVLQFMSPGCGPCGGLLPDVARWQTSLAERVTLAVIATGTVEDNRPIWDEHGMTNVLLDSEDAVFNAYRISSTPTAIAVTPDGLVASPPAGGLHMPEVVMRMLVRRDTNAVDHAVDAPPLVVTHVAPRGA